MPKLVVELVPSPTWEANLRSELTSAQWDRLRKATYQRAGYHCEICGGQGHRHPVECHEKWEYNDTTHTQKLVGLESLCPDCHGVRHIGHTLSRGRKLFEKSLDHLCKVNGWTPEEAGGHVLKAMRVWQERSGHPWTLDLTWLTHAKL